MSNEIKRKIDSFRIVFPPLTHAISNSIAYAKNDVLVPIFNVRYVAEKISRILFLIQLARAVYFRVPIALPWFAKKFLKMKTFPFILF